MEVINRIIDNKKYTTTQTEAIKEKLSYESKEIISGIKRTKEAFKRDEEGLYTETEEFHADNLSKRYEMLNRFDLSEHN